MLKPGSTLTTQEQDSKWGKPLPGDWLMMTPVDAVSTSFIGQVTGEGNGEKIILFVHFLYSDSWSLFLWDFHSAWITNWIDSGRVDVRGQLNVTKSISQIIVILMQWDSCPSSSLPRKGMCLPYVMNQRMSVHFHLHSCRQNCWMTALESRKSFLRRFILFYTLHFCCSFLQSTYFNLLKGGCEHSVNTNKTWPTTTSQLQKHHKTGFKTADKELTVHQGGTSVKYIFFSLLVIYIYIYIRGRVHPLE